jgi:hypothetical protein
MRGNHLVMVSSRSGELLLEMTPSNIFTRNVTNKLSTYHVMHVVLDTPETVRLDNTHRALMLGSDLPSFVRVMREFTFTEEPSYRIRIELLPGIDGRARSSDPE